MSEIFSVGQRVRVRLNTSECAQEGRLHGWAAQGRTGMIMWEEEHPDNHRYCVGYFHPQVVVEGFKPFSPQFHNFFAPWEIEEILP